MPVGCSSLLEAYLCCARSALNRIEVFLDNCFTCSVNIINALEPITHPPQIYCSPLMNILL